MDDSEPFSQVDGAFATLLLISHPPLLAIGGGGLSLLVSLQQPVHMLEKLASYCLWSILFLSVFFVHCRIDIRAVAPHSFCSGSSYHPLRIRSYFETGDDLNYFRCGYYGIVVDHGCRSLLLP